MTDDMKTAREIMELSFRAGVTDADIEAAIAAALKAARGEWQPIETAPKDGTEVDLWALGRRVSDCRWGRPTHANWGDRYGRDQALPKQWMTRTGCSWDRRNGEPTHWRPLPAPPVSP